MRIRILSEIRSCVVRILATDTFKFCSFRLCTCSRGVNLTSSTLSDEQCGTGSTSICFLTLQSGHVHDLLLRELLLRSFQDFLLRLGSGQVHDLLHRAVLHGLLQYDLHSFSKFSPGTETATSTISENPQRGLDSEEGQDLLERCRYLRRGNIATLDSQRSQNCTCQ